MKTFSTILILILQCIVILCQNVERFNCVTGEISKSGEFCLLTNINTEGRFIPVSDSPFIVKEFEIRNSTVKLLTPDICRQFPNIEKFTASEVGIETLDEDTFKDCHNLREIRILRNNIKRFERNLFNRNTNLELLYFGINQLTQIPSELFQNLNKLEDLGFASMKFDKFPKNVFEDLRNLKVLWVYHDALLDLDAEDILRAMPRLEKIYLRDNDFKCTRLRTILDLFKSRNVTLDKTIWEGNERVRDYTVSYVEGIECIDDAIYDDIVKRRNVSGEDKPLGNRFDDMMPSGPMNQQLAYIHKQIVTLKDAYEYKMNELTTAHKAEMDDLRTKLSIMHQNLDSKMTDMLSKMSGCQHHHGGPGGFYQHRHYNKSS